jgi:hypothetical protein
MLDRSDTPNLFAQATPVEHDPPPPEDLLADPRPARQPRRERSPRPERPTRAERPARAPLVRSRIRALRTAALARLGQLRPYRRYAPVAALLFLLLTHPAGCGRSVPPAAVTSGSSATPVEGAALVVRTVTVTAPAPPKRAVPRRARPKPRPRGAAGHAPARVAAGHSPRATAAPTVPASAPSFSYQPAVTQHPPPSSGGRNEEFGFER